MTKGNFSHVRQVSPFWWFSIPLGPLINLLKKATITGSRTLPTQVKNGLDQGNGGARLSLCVHGVTTGAGRETLWAARPAVGIVEPKALEVDAKHLRKVLSGAARARQPIGSVALCLSCSLGAVLEDDPLLAVVLPLAALAEVLVL